MWNILLPLLLFLGLGVAQNDSVCVTATVNHDPDGLQCTIYSQADFAEISTDVTALSLAFHSTHSVTLGAGTIPSLPKLDYLQMDVTYVAELPASVFQNLGQLNEISIYKHSTTEFRIRVGAFRGLTSLQTLGISHLEIFGLTAGVFDDLGELSNLFLNNNQLTELPDRLFQGLGKLHSLSLFKNYIADLQKVDFSGLDGIRQLVLSDNQIPGLEAGAFSGLSHLEELTIESNGISTIGPSAFADLANVHTMHLEANLLSKLEPNSFSGMASLKSLYLAENDLSNVDDAFGALNSLEELHLQNNNFQMLSAKTFAGLPALRTLDLSGNKLTVLSSNAFVNLTNLEKLHLHQNSLNNIYQHAFNGLGSLRLLNLRHNNLRSIPQALTDLGDDCSLDLVSNQWDCSNVTWLAEWYADRQQAAGGCQQDLVDDIFIDAQEVACHSPTDMQNENLVMLATSQGAEICGQVSNGETDDWLTDGEKAALVTCLILLALIIVLLVVLCIYLRQKKYAFWTPPKNDEGEKGVQRRDKLLYTARHKTPSFYWDPESGRLENIWEQKSGEKQRQDAVDHAYSNPGLVDNSPAARRRRDSENSDFRQQDYMNGVVVVDAKEIKTSDLSTPDIRYQTETPIKMKQSSADSPDPKKKGAANPSFFGDLNPDEVQAAPPLTKNRRLELRPSTSTSGDSDHSEQQEEYPQVVVPGHSGHQKLPPKQDLYKQQDEEQQHQPSDEEVATFENPEYMLHNKASEVQSSKESLNSTTAQQREPRDYIAEFRKYSARVKPSGADSDTSLENEVSSLREQPGFVVVELDNEGEPGPLGDKAAPPVRVPTSPRVLVPEPDRESIEDTRRRSSTSPASSLQDGADSGVRDSMSETGIHLAQADQVSDRLSRYSSNSENDPNSVHGSQHLESDQDVPGHV